MKTGYYLELLMPETMKLLGSTKSKMTKDENGKNVPYLEITEVVLVHCNIVQNKSFGEVLNTCFKIFLFLKTFNFEFSYIEVWFTDQNSKPLEKEDKKITLVINWSVKY